MRKPGRPGWEGLSLVVESQGREAAPGRVAARELDVAGREGEAKEKPQDEQAHHRRRPGLRARQAPIGRREEDREQSRLEKQRVPLELVEDLPGDREGQVENPAGQEARGRRKPQHRQQRGSRAGSAQQAERAVARAEPAEGGQQIEAHPARLPPHGVEKLGHRKDPARSDEALNLDPERDERDQVAKPDRSQEEIVRDPVFGLLDARAPEDAGRGRSALTVAGDEAVGKLRDSGEAGQDLVGLEQPPPSRCFAEGPEDRPRSFHDLAGRQYELNRARKGLPRNLGETPCDLLGRRVIHGRTRFRLPPRDPAPAEAAVAVEDQEGPERRRGDASRLGHRQGV